MPVSLNTFTALGRLEMIAENVLPVCMVLCDLLPKASISDLDSYSAKTKRSSVPSVSFDKTVQI